MSSAIAKIASLIVGLLLIVSGTVLLTEDFGRDTASLQPIASLIVALGVAAVGAAILSGMVKASGSEVKPLGLSIEATGGFALFVITLMFLLTFPAGEGEQPAATATYEVSTYCSVCCPQGRQNCPATGTGRASDLITARNQALEQCVAGGGQLWSCEENLVQVSP